VPREVACELCRDCRTNVEGSGPEEVQVQVQVRRLCLYKLDQEGTT